MPVAYAFSMGLPLWALLLSLLLYDSLALSSEGWALLHFRSGIEEDPHNALIGWNAEDKDPCTWLGIRCENGAVTSINLSRLCLKGTLSPELGQLTSLQELLLQENCLMGVIPRQFGELKNLKVLDLSHNDFTGHLPQDLGNLACINELAKSTTVCETGSCCVNCLQTADFSCNFFNGELPSCLDHLPRLSFHQNCLLGEELPNQRSFENCTKRSSVAPHRVLQMAGDAGVGSNSSTNSTNVTGWNVSVEGSPAPSPVPEAKTNIFSTGSSEPPSPGGSPTQSPGGSPTPEVVSPPAVGSGSSTNRVVWVTVSVSSAVIILFVGTLAFFYYRRKVFSFSRLKAAPVRPWKSSMSGELQKGFIQGVPAFSGTELEAACEGFSNIIGSSPNVVLFKGTLSNDKEIAVTSIRQSAKSWSSHSEMIFWRKVESLSQMNHPNLVKLVGYYAEEDPFVRMLVFEYVPNGTVFEHLHNKEFEHLDWAMRMKIIMGVAEALEYMHHDLKSPVAHTKLDTKAVYLTEDYSAKLADFGVWKASSHKGGMASSRQINDNDDLELSDRLAPDLDSGLSDFGSFLLEMISGRPTFSKELGSISQWALDYLSPLGLVDHIIDPNLRAYNSEELKVIGSLAMECLQEGKSRATSMKEITAHLRASLKSLDEPTIPKSDPLLWAQLEILSQE